MFKNFFQFVLLLWTYGKKFYNGIYVPNEFVKLVLRKAKTLRRSSPESVPRVYQ